MEQILKTITTKQGGTVSLIKPQNGNPFFRYLAGAVATTDSFRYLIRQHGQEDTATVNIQVNQPQNNQPDDQKDFLSALNGFLKCVDGFMDGSPNIMAITNLLGIDEGEVLNDDWIEKVFNNFYFFNYVKESPEFNMEQHVGKYIYHGQDGGYWDFQPGGHEIMILFPSRPDNQENDASWVIRSLKATTAEKERGYNHLPTSFDTELTLNQKQVFGIRAEQIKYHEKSNIPLYADIEAIALPYMLRFHLSNDGAQEFDLRCDISDDHDCHLGLDSRWMLNQDLGQELNTDNLNMIHGELRMNEITLTGLETLWLALSSNVEEQEKFDGMLKVNCLLKGEKIGNLSYEIKSETFTMIFNNGDRLNLNNIIKEHFKQYFNAPKPNGDIRNNAFDIESNANRRTVSKPVNSPLETKEKVVNNLAEAVGRRTIRLGNTTPKVLGGVTSIFKKNEPKNDFISSPGFIDSTGAIIPLVDTGVTSHEHGKLFTVPDTAIITPSDRKGFVTAPVETITAKDSAKPTATIKPLEGKTTASRTTTIKPVTTKTTAVKSPAVKPATTAKKATTVKTATTKTPIVKPASTKASTKIVTPKKVSTTKKRSS